MIDRVVGGAGPEAGRRCRSASSGSPPGLFDGSLCFGGEESAGASFLRRDGTVWTTDKDGLILDLLAAEITAAHRQGPRRALPRADRRSSARPYYTRIDAPATPAAEGGAQEALARARSPTTELAGEPITAKLTRAPGNDAADRRAEGRRPRTAGSPPGPPGTENIYKIYAESFRDRPISTPSWNRPARSSAMRFAGGAS